MPKEKLLFFIGIWLILLSYFIGLSTEVKNYLFIATGLLLICLSYESKFKDFRHKRDQVEKESDLKPEEIKKVEVDTRGTVTEKTPAYLRTSYVEPEMKVRKIKTEKKPRVINEENIFVVKETESNQNLTDEEDVIVISSDGGK